MSTELYFVSSAIQCLRWRVIPDRNTKRELHNRNNHTVDKIEYSIGLLNDLDRIRKVYGVKINIDKKNVMIIQYNQAKWFNSKSSLMLRRVKMLYMAEIAYETENK